MLISTHTDINNHRKQRNKEAYDEKSKINRTEEISQLGNCESKRESQVKQAWKEARNNGIHKLTYRFQIFLRDAVNFGTPLCNRHRGTDKRIQDDLPSEKGMKLEKIGGEGVREGREEGYGIG